MDWKEVKDTGITSGLYLCYRLGHFDIFEYNSDANIWYYLNQSDEPIEEIPEYYCKLEYPDFYKLRNN